MNLEITADGTYPFKLQAGVHRLDIEGTLASGFSAALHAGASEDGTNHASVPSPFNVPIVFSGSSPIVPPLIQGAGNYSLVVTGFSGSSNVAAVLRKSSESH